MIVIKRTVFAATTFMVVIKTFMVIIKRIVFVIKTFMVTTKTFMVGTKRTDFTASVIPFDIYNPHMCL